MSLSTGQVLNNRYRIVKLLGQGGFGAVYKAWDLTFKLPTAVKENNETSPDAQNQFLREARLLRTLRHPNLPQVSDYFILPGNSGPDPSGGNGAAYLVMDFVEGDDLAEKLRSLGGPLDEAQALDWISQICDALAYLHRQNPPVIHRDVKPANIKITPDGRAMLVDFGIAKSSAPGTPTTSGARAVTPGYSPLEQYGAGGRTEARTDVYALGATLYTLLTGQAPPEATERSLSAALPAPRQVNPKISPRVEAAVLKAMELAPEKRFTSVAEFKAALLPESMLAETTRAPSPDILEADRRATEGGQAAKPGVVQPQHGGAFMAPAPAPAPGSPIGGFGGAPAPAPTVGGPSMPPATPTDVSRSRRKWMLPCAGVALLALIAAAVGCVFFYRMVQNGRIAAGALSTRAVSTLNAVIGTPAASGVGTPESGGQAPGVTGSPQVSGLSVPVGLLDGAAVTFGDPGSQVMYTIVSAERQQLNDGSTLLHLRVRAWTDAGGGLNFWSDSFRLYIRDQRLAPVNNLNEVVNRDQTVDGDVDFTIDNSLSEAALVITYGEAIKQLRLSIPAAGSGAQPIPSQTPPGGGTPAAAGVQPVELPDGVEVIFGDPGSQVKYTILAAERRPSDTGGYLLHLRVRAWTDAGGGLNFWSDSFRLYVGDQHLAPSNNLNEVVGRDQTVDGDVDFKIDTSLTEATLVIAYGEATKQLHLVFPAAGSGAQPIPTQTPPGGETPAAAGVQPVELPDGVEVIFGDPGSQVKYTILSTERRPDDSGGYLLHLRVRAWTDARGGLNFWSDSFRLYVGDQHLAPSNNLNEVLDRDQTLEGDINFHIEAALKDAVLVITYGGATRQLHLVFP